MIRRPAPAKVTAVSAILTLAVGMAETSCGSAKHANDSVPLMFGQEEPSFYIVVWATAVCGIIPADARNNPHSTMALATSFFIQ